MKQPKFIQGEFYVFKNGVNIYEYIGEVSRNGTDLFHFKEVRWGISVHFHGASLIPASSDRIAKILISIDIDETIKRLTEEQQLIINSIHGDI